VTATASTLTELVAEALGFAAAAAAHEDTCLEMLAHAARVARFFYADPCADLTPASTGYTADNTDNAGAARRTGAAALAAVLGASTGWHATRNATGTATHAFAVTVFAPAFLADALAEILPAITERLDSLLKTAVRARREQLKADGVTGRERARRIAVYRRDWERAAWAKIADGVAAKPLGRREHIGMAAAAAAFDYPAAALAAA